MTSSGSASDLNCGRKRTRPRATKQPSANPADGNEVPAPSQPSRASRKRLRLVFRGGAHTGTAQSCNSANGGLSALLREPVAGCAQERERTTYRVLSVFDGVSCARVALERAVSARPSDAALLDIEYHASEVCPRARAVAARNWPSTIQHGDVRALTWRVDDGALPLDCLVGGSPCTDLTTAGKQAGLGGKESSLFWEFVRLLREARPKHFLFENVHSMSPAAEREISAALGCEPHAVDAACFGPCVRKRKFWTSLPVSHDASAALAPDASTIADVMLSDAELAAPSAQPLDGAFEPVERLQMHEPHRSPTGTVVVGKVVDPSRPPPRAPQARPEPLSAGQAPTFRTAYDARARRQATRAHEERLRVYSSGAKLAAMTQSAGGLRVQLPCGRVRTLDTREIERFQGLPDNYTAAVVDGKPLTRSVRAALVGLAFHPRVIAWFLQHAPALRAAPL